MGHRAKRRVSKFLIKWTAPAPRHPGAKMVVVGKRHDERSRPPCRLPLSVLISPSTGFKSTGSTPLESPPSSDGFAGRRSSSFSKALEPCLVGMEACATAHHWARELIALGHEVKLMPPAYVKAYVKRNKNDAADAEAICEAVTRPSMRFVPIKDVDQQSVLMLHRARDAVDPPAHHAGQRAARPHGRVRNHRAGRKDCATSNN